MAESLTADSFAKLDSPAWQGTADQRPRLNMGKPHFHAQFAELIELDLGNSSG